MDNCIRVLVVEDSAEDTFLMIRELQRAGYSVDFERVETRAQMIAALDDSIWDVIICDYALPHFGGLDALAIYLEKDIVAPFIIVSGAVGEERAVEAVKAGAHDYVMKNNLARLAGVVKQEISAAQKRLLRHHTDATAAYLASVVQSSDDAIICQTLDGTIVSWNSGAERLYGYTADEILGNSISILTPRYLPDQFSEIMQKISQGLHVESYETVRLRKNGSPVDVSLRISPIRDNMGKIMGASSISRDITRRKQEDTDRLTLIQDLTTALSHNAPGATPGHDAASSTGHAATTSNS